MILFTAIIALLGVYTVAPVAILAYSNPMVQDKVLAAALLLTNALAITWLATLALYGKIRD